MLRYTITKKTSAVQKEIVRATDPLGTLYKIYGILIKTVRKVKKLLASVASHLLLWFYPEQCVRL